MHLAANIRGCSSFLRPNNTSKDGDEREKRNIEMTHEDMLCCSFTEYCSTYQMS